MFQDNPIEINNKTGTVFDKYWYIDLNELN